MLHTHDNTLVLISILVAIFASYAALDLANSITVARGKVVRLAWLTGGSVAMGVGIWSMHFVAMLAFRLPGIPIAYDVPLLILSVLVAIIASAIALFIISRRTVTWLSFVIGSLMMGAAISGMHYIGIASMRMAAEVSWNRLLVIASIVIAISASFAALQIAFQTRTDLSPKGFLKRVGGGVVMGFAISGMHYTAMAAMSFYPGPELVLQSEYLLATQGLAVSVIGATLLILAIALCGSIVDRALARHLAMTEQVTRILESITDGFYSIDRDWHFSYVNRVAQDAFRSLMRKNSENLGGKNLWASVPELLGTKFESAFRDAMRTGKLVQIEEFFPPFDIWMEARCYPSAEGLSVYFRDVTERKRHEQALREAIRARDEFLSIASHELKTPLTSLKLQTQMRQRSLGKGDFDAFQLEKMGKSLETDSRQIERLTRLIDDMLDISRINTGKLTILRERFDLCELVKDVIERFAGQFEASGCEVDFDRKESVFGNWDRFRIEQAVTNLLTNAVRYGAGKPIHVQVEGGDGCVRVIVRDEGIGIAKEHQKRIFRRFERAVPAAEFSGLGLGLYIVKEILKMHGGTIRVRSEPGHGAEFTIELPLG